MKRPLQTTLSKFGRIVFTSRPRSAESRSGRREARQSDLRPLDALNYAWLLRSCSRERTAQHDRADAMTACHAACQMPDMSRRTLLLQEWRRLYYIMGEKQNGNPYTVITAVTVNEWKYPSVTPCGSDRRPHARPEHERARGRWPSAQHAHQRGARSNLGGRPPAPRAGLPKRSRAEGADRPALSANF